MPQLYGLGGRYQHIVQSVISDIFRILFRTQYHTAAEIGAKRNSHRIYFIKGNPIFYLVLIPPEQGFCIFYIEVNKLSVLPAAVLFC